jgi:hypothetical protein
MLSRTVFALLITTGCMAGCAVDTTETDSGEADVAALEHARFECLTDNTISAEKRHGLKFSVKGLGNRNAQKVSWIFPDARAKELDVPLSASPANSPLSALNENYRAKLDTKGLTVTGDSSGFYQVEMTLYRNSGFKAGYVRVTDNGDGLGNMYSTVKCTVTPVNAAGVALTDATQQATAERKLTPATLSAALSTSQRELRDAAAQSGECTFGVRAFHAPLGTRDAAAAAALVLETLTYKRYRDVQPAASVEEQRATVLEWVSEASEPQLDALMAGLSSFDGAPTNANIWVRSDDIPGASREWAEHVLVYHYARSNKVVTVSMKCVM